MKHLYYTFSSFILEILEIGYCFKKEISVPWNWQVEGVDSSLWFDAQAHVDLNFGESQSQALSASLVFQKCHRFFQDTGAMSC